jgi:hypothetical protein
MKLEIAIRCKYMYIETNKNQRDSMWKSVSVRMSKLLEEKYCLIQLLFVFLTC